MKKKQQNRLVHFYPAPHHGKQHILGRKNNTFNHERMKSLCLPINAWQKDMRITAQSCVCITGQQKQKMPGRAHIINQGKTNNNEHIDTNQARTKKRANAGGGGRKKNYVHES